MSHLRNSIIDQIAGLLNTAPTNWRRVFTQRIVSSRVVETYLMVYFDSEDVEKLLVHPQNIYRCTVDLRVEAVVKLPNDFEALEDTIGNIAEEIQIKLTYSSAQAAAPEIKDLALLNTSVSLEEAQHLLVLSQIWQFQYMINEGSPSA